MLAPAIVRKALDLAPDAMAVVDRNGKILLMNRQVTTLFGYEPQELDQQSIDLLLPERFRASHVQHRQDYAAHLRVRRMGDNRDLVALRKDGSEFPAEISLSPIADRSGLLVVVAIRDVSDRHRAELALRESEERFRELGGQSRDVIWIVGLDPVRMLYVSPSLERIWGLAPSQLYQDPTAWEPCVHPEDRLRVQQAWTDACEPAVTRGFESEYRIIRSDGSTCWLSDVLTPIRNAAGTAIRLCGVSRDISAQRRLEQALLHATDREKRNIGHDLHEGLGQDLTALSLLAGALQSSLRKSGRPDVDGLPDLELLARRAITTCRSISHGLSPLGYSNGSLTSALREMVAAHRDSFGVDVRFADFSSAPLRLTDLAAEQLYRIAQEAVANARRHAHANVITVHLHVEPATVRLTVEDNGIGLPDAIAESDGMGLRIMQYRARLVGARLSFAAGPYGGTVVRCECAQARSPDPGVARARLPALP